MRLILKSIIFGAFILFIISPPNSYGQWQTSGSDIYYTNGNVGIGTSGPSTMLHVKSGDITIQRPSGAALILRRYGDKSPATIKGMSGQYSSRQGIEFNTSNVPGAMAITALGNVGVGTTSPSSKFTVNGMVKAEEVIVIENVGADFVFADDYLLPTLADVERFISRNKHLPEIPSAAEMKEHGVKIGDFQMKLLQKIEELTLHIIKMEKRISQLEQENHYLKENKN